MKIREKLFTVEYIKSNVIKFDKWQILAENCYDTDCIDFIDAVINSKVLIKNELEELLHNTINAELIDHKENILNQVNKTKLKKIHHIA